MQSIPVLYQFLGAIALLAAGAGLAFKAENKLGYLLMLAGIAWGVYIFPQFMAMAR